jgi:hypothetical protein
MKLLSRYLSLKASCCQWAMMLDNITMLALGYRASKYRWSNCQVYTHYIFKIPVLQKLEWFKAKHGYSSHRISPEANFIGPFTKIGEWAILSMRTTQVDTGWPTEQTK